MRRINRIGRKAEERESGGRAIRLAGFFGGLSCIGRAEYWPSAWGLRGPSAETWPPRFSCFRQSIHQGGPSNAPQVFLSFRRVDRRLSTSIPLSPVFPLTQTIDSEVPLRQRTSPVPGKTMDIPQELLGIVEPFILAEIDFKNVHPLFNRSSGSPGNVLIIQILKLESHTFLQRMQIVQRAATSTVNKAPFPKYAGNKFSDCSIFQG